MNEHITTDLLIDYLHQELSPADDARVLAHVSACRACSAELESESALTEALRFAAASDELEVPAMLKARVWEAVRTEPGRSIWPAWLRPAVAFPAAAIVAAGLIFSIGAVQNSGPRITADYYLAQHASGRANPLTDPVSHPVDTTEESDAQLPSGTFASFTAPFDAAEPVAAR